MSRTLCHLLSSLILVPSFLGGCAKDSCEVDPSGAECQISPTTPNGPIDAGGFDGPGNPVRTEVLPHRLSRTEGGTVSVRVAGYAGATVQLVQHLEALNNDRAMGALDASATLSFAVAAADLRPYAPGLAEIVVRKSGLPELRFPLRLFNPPNFEADAAQKRWTMTSARLQIGNNPSKTDSEPVVVGGARGNLLHVLAHYRDGGSLNQSQVLTTYSVNLSSQPRLLPQAGRWLVPQPVYDRDQAVGFAMADTTSVFAGFKFDDVITPSRLTRCTGVSSCEPSNGQPNGAKHIAHLTGEPSGQLEAALVNGQVRAYSDILAELEVEIDARDRLPAAVAGLSVGDLDGDGFTDLAVFSAPGGSEAAFLYRSGALRYSEIYTSGLRSLMGMTTATAVRIGDVDRDGLADVLFAQGAGITIAANQANGSFKPIFNHPGLSDGSGPLGDVVSIAAARVHPSPDARASVVLVSRKNSKLAVLVNQATD